MATRLAQISEYDPPDPNVFAEARYRIRVSFPHAGRWTYTVVAGRRSFRFPAATIGAGAPRIRTGYVAFPEGSRAERQGGGGAIVGDPEPASGEPGGGALPPQVIEPPDEDGGGLTPWVPAAGLALAGAAAIGWRRRR
jgi:MYXO-CTERM domain-containing protein